MNDYESQQKKKGQKNRTFRVKVRAIKQNHRRFDLINKITKKYINKKRW